MGQQETTMGANLVPIVRNFAIHTETFSANDHAVQDGCVTSGTHRVLRFDFSSHNIGDADLVVGAPADHPDWFVLSASHGHYHLKDFNEFTLSNCSGHQVAQGYKQAFCLIDIEHRSAWGPASPQFTNCNSNQGISAGWADLYNSGLACQFVVIDTVPDGDYVLISTTNAQRIIPEDTYADNTIFTGLRMSGDSVTEIAPCFPLGRLDKWEAVVQILFGVVNDGGGLVITPGGRPIPIDPWGPLRLAAPKRDILIGLAITELGSIASTEARRELEKSGLNLMSKALEQLRRSLRS